MHPYSTLLPTYMGVCTGGGGVHSDAKWEIFQFSPFFSTMSFRRGGGGYVIPFQNLQEMAVLERYGLGGGVGGHIFEFPGARYLLIPNVCVCVCVCEMALQ